MTRSRSRLTPLLALGLAAGLLPASAAAADPSPTPTPAPAVYGGVLASGGEVSTAPGWLGTARSFSLRWSKPTVFPAGVSKWNRVDIRAKAGLGAACPTSEPTLDGSTSLKSPGATVSGVAVKLSSYLKCYDVTVYYVGDDGKHYASAKGTVRKATPGAKGNKADSKVFFLSVEPRVVGTTPTVATASGISLTFSTTQPAPLFTGEVQKWSLATVTRLKANTASSDGKCAFPNQNDATGKALYHTDGKVTSVLAKLNSTVDGGDTLVSATVTGLLVPADGYCRGFRVTLRDNRNRVATEVSGSYLQPKATASSSASTAP